jgi:acyl-coenzyme A synthetase/AMP-(fatty) acid ligase
MFTAPTAIRAIKRESPEAGHRQGHDLSRLRTLFLAGERCDPDTLHWGEEVLDRPVIDHWWQTETGWAIACNCMGIEQLPVKPGSPTKAVPGYEVQILDEQGEPVGAGEVEAICLRLPLPPGCRRMPATIEDASVLEDFKQTLSDMGQKAPGRGTDPLRIFGTAHQPDGWFQGRGAAAATRGRRPGLRPQSTHFHGSPSAA